MAHKFNYDPIKNSLTITLFRNTQMEDVLYIYAHNNHDCRLQYQAAPPKSTAECWSKVQAQKQLCPAPKTTAACELALR